MSDSPLNVLHLVDAMGGSEHLWGKERVVLSLLEVQRASGEISPRLATFAPSILQRRAADAGFQTCVLAEKKHRWTPAWGRALAQDLALHRPTVLHTHGYKANVVGRLGGVRKAAAGVVATCHGWVDTSMSLKLYNWLDRTTARWSGAVTVPDPNMMRRFGRGTNVMVVPNGVADRPPPGLPARRQAREKFGWLDHQIVVGSLGRLSIEKGVLEYLESARLCTAPNVLWVCAGAGPLETEVTSNAPANFRCCGYVDSDEFLAGIDIFVQPSRTEALSLALLEAARSALPIVATDVGGTSFAIRNDHEGLLIPPADPKATVDAILRLVGDNALKNRLAQAARKRFDEALGLSAVHRRFAEIYHSVCTAQ